MARELPTGTVTFLFTDIEGSTIALQQDPEGYEELLLAHRRIVRDALARHGGVEVETEGDAFFAAFSSGKSAVAAAAVAQDGLAGGPLRVRMGLHTGEARVADGGYVGLDVHRAARIAGAAHGGQVVLSRSTRELVDVEVRDLGEHRLKDLSAPEHLFQLGPSEFPPLRTLRRTNLPVPATPFVGRKQELRAVRALIEEGARVITLVGSGGSGKTRLALQAAGELSDRFPDGVFWVPLAPLRDPGLVPPTVAEAVGAVEELSAHLQSLKLLLVLDNVEHLVEAAADVAATAIAAPGVVVIATGREPLRVDVEWELRVDPLQEVEAVQLFEQRARAVGSAVASDDVAAICRRLDCLPLAIELAAARTRVLDPAALLERLDHALPLLVGGARNVPERQRTLRATLEWSYDLLPPDEQRLFRHLGVFTGGCTLEAAQVVGEEDLDAVQSLVERSLLRHSGGRYWMLETIRELAVEKLIASGEEQPLRARHAAFFAAAVETGKARYIGAIAPEWLERMDADRDNVRAVLEWAAEAEETELLQRLCVTLAWYWHLRTRHTEALQWIDRACAHPVGSPSLKLELLSRESNLAWREGDYDRARAAAESEIDLAREIGDDPALADGLLELGNALHSQGDPEGAERAYEESASVAKAADATWAEYSALANLGTTALARGDFARARAIQLESLQRSLELGDFQGEAVSRHNIGLSYLSEKLHAEAAPYLIRSLEIGVALKWPEGVLFPLEALVVALAGFGDPAEAAELLGAAAAARTELHMHIEDIEARLVERADGELRTALGAREFERLFTLGAEISMDEAAAAALAAARAALERGPLQL